MIFNTTRRNKALITLGLMLLVGVGISRSRDINASPAESARAAALPASQEIPSTSTVSGAWNYQKTRISAPNHQLELILRDLSADTDYIVGVRSEGKASAELIAGEVSFITPYSQTTRFLSRIENLPQEQITVQDGVLEIAALSQSSKSLLIYITVAPGTEVSVKTANRVLARATPANGLIIHNGVSVNEEIQGVRTLVSLLMKGDATPSTALLVKTPDNQYLATPKGLAANLLSFKKPIYPAGLTVDGIEQVILRIAIDETGNVVKVNAVRGNPTFTEATRQAVGEWKFRPFSVGDKVIPVQASVAFFFGKDGAIHSPILNELSK